MGILIGIIICSFLLGIYLYFANLMMFSDTTMVKLLITTKPSKVIDNCIQSITTENPIQTILGIIIYFVFGLCGMLLGTIIHLNLYKGEEVQENNKTITSCESACNSQFIQEVLDNRDFLEEYNRIRNIHKDISELDDIYRNYNNRRIENIINQDNKNTKDKTLVVFDAHMKNVSGDYDPLNGISATINNEALNSGNFISGRTVYMTEEEYQDIDTALFNYFTNNNLDNIKVIILVDDYKYNTYNGAFKHLLLNVTNKSIEEILGNIDFA